MSSISVKMIKMLEASIPKMLAEVATHAAISTTHTTPADKNRVIVTADENFEGKRTLYVYDEGTTTWVFVGVVDELPMEIFFTEQRNIYLTTKDRDHIKFGDILPYPDLATLEVKNPALKNKLYMLNNGEIYYYTGTEYKMITGAGGAGGGASETNWLTDVATFADRDTTHTTPAAYDAVKVLVDETHDGQPTWYEHDGTNWLYRGIYFEESLQTIVSNRNTRVDNIEPDTDYVLPFKYIIGNKHLEIYFEGELLTEGIDYVEDTLTVGYVTDKIQFKNSIPKQARLVYRRTLSSIIENAIIARTSKDVVGEYIGLTVNIENNTQTAFSIAPNLPIGTKRTIRKVFGTAEEITINVMEDEFIVEPTRKSLTLTSRGDFWTLVKVTDTRWDIEAGRQRGNGFVREATGVMTCKGESNTLTTGDTPTDAIFVVDNAFVFPKVFKSIPSVTVVGKGLTEFGFATAKDDVTVNGFTAKGGSFNDLVDLKIAYTATGKWYEEV